jgi:hypothetical protein
MNRRPFIAALGALWAAGLLAPAGRLAGSRPVRAVRAWLARRAPGRLVPLDPARVRRPGPWAG